MSPEAHPLKEKTQDFVQKRIKNAGDPFEAASHAADEIIGAAVRKTEGKPGAISKADIVRDVCHGAMAGLLLADLDIAKGAVVLIGSMAEVAQEIKVDPAELLTWSLEGVARLTPLVSLQRMSDVGHAIDAQFMGTAEIFRELCRKAQTP